MKSTLNTHLLSSLPRVLRMTHREVSDASGISIACWYRLVKNPEKITVQQLLNLSNGLCVPVRLFFSSNKTDFVGVREDYILPSSVYLECYYDSEAVQQRIGNGTATSWRDAATAVGMHWTNAAKSLLAVSRTPVVRLLDLCKAFDFNLFEFLIDPNKKRQGEIKSAPLSDIADLRQQICSLSRSIDEIADKYQTLQTMHNALLKRYELLERAFYENLGGDVVGLGMAAEPLSSDN